MRFDKVLKTSIVITVYVKGFLETIVIIILLFETATEKTELVVNLHNYIDG